MGGISVGHRVNVGAAVGYLVGTRSVGYMVGSSSHPPRNSFFDAFFEDFDFNHRFTTQSLSSVGCLVRWSFPGEGFRVFDLDDDEPFLFDDARPMGAAVGSCVRLLANVGDGVVGVVGVATVGREVGVAPDVLEVVIEVGNVAGVVDVVEDASESPGVVITNVS